MSKKILWDFNYLSWNENVITMVFIIKNLDKGWNWPKLSQIIDIKDIISSVQT